MNLHAPKGIDVENWFIECYRKYKGHPMWILLGLYKGNYNKFFMAVVFFFIKHCPVWVLPIITANIINDITSGAPDAYQHIFIEAIIMVCTDCTQHSDQLYVYKIQIAGNKICGNGT